MAVPIPLRPIPLWEHTPDGRPRWGKEQLIHRYKQGPRAFERGFRMRAFDDSEASFPSFHLCEVPGLALGDLARAQWPKFTGVDLSSKKRPGNAIVTVAVDPRTRRRYLVDVRFGAWRSSETAEQINDVNRTFNPSLIMVEDNAYQEALLDWISDSKDRFQFWTKLEATTTTGGKKANAEKGLPSLEVEFRNGAWVFPLDEYQNAGIDDPNPKKAAFARLAYEFKHHPLASHNDAVMATWFARQGIEIFGGLAFGTTDSDLSDLTVR